MELSKFKEASNEYSAKASEITRQLSLAGIGIIWLFKNTNDKDLATNINKPLLEPFLVFPLLFLVLALLADLMQYFIGAEIWIAFFRKKEKEFPGKNPNIQAPSNLRIPIYVCYYIKIALMVFSYIFIIGFLITKI